MVIIVSTIREGLNATHKSGWQTLKSIDFIGNCFVARRSRATKQFQTSKTLFPIKFNFICMGNSLGEHSHDD
jgi:hypothetical protein